MLEIAIVLTLIAFLTGLFLPTIGTWSDRIAVFRAEAELVGFYNRARLIATYRSSRVRVAFTNDSLAAVVELDGDSTVARLQGPSRYGVTLDASRSVIRLYPNGIGLGAANSKLVLRRGRASDSLTISRMGRLKRWP